MNFGERLINLGCGKNLLPPPWANYDRELDITKPLPFPSDSADQICIEHCMEHVTAPDAFRFMQECHRVLKQKGTLRICVPELERLSKEKAANIITGHGHLMVYNLANLTAMLWAAGFVYALKVPFDEATDGHWKVIGKEQDALETLRVLATK